jgi:DNA-binding transcriptional ArsR family regulator
MVKHRAESLDAVFAALADPIRRGILERLAQGETSVGELAAPYKVSAPAISRHLRVLEAAGLMERTKRGRVHRCRLRTEPMHSAEKWLAEHTAFWEAHLDRLGEFLEQEM